MLRLALDTNVWISAFLTQGGVCEKLVRSAHHVPVRLVTSPFIVQEVESVLSDKLRMPETIVKERLRHILLNSQLVEPRTKVRIILNCEDDNRILDCALAGRASYIVTGDREHLLPLGSHEGIVIVTPRHMVELLKL